MSFNIKSIVPFATDNADLDPRINIFIYRKEVVVVQSIQPYLVSDAGVEYPGHVADACSIPKPPPGNDIGYKKPEGEFYRRMNVLYGGNESGTGWINSADRCADTLRLYADKYHPAEAPKRVGIPASVRAIFETQQSVAV